MRHAASDVPLGGSPFPPIADYAFLSDCEVCVLVAPTGNVEWMCLPRFDGKSIFGTMLDRDAGSFRLAPVDTAVPAGRRYLPGTMVLETTWGTRTGWVIVRDVLLIGPWHHDTDRSHTHRRSPTDTDADHVLLRTMRCVNGYVEIHMECEPKPDYGSKRVDWEYDGPGYASASRAAAPARAPRCGTATRRSWRCRGPSTPRRARTTRPTTASSTPPTTGMSGCRAASSPTTRGARTCSAARSRSRG